MHRRSNYPPLKRSAGRNQNMGAELRLLAPRHPAGRSAQSASCYSRQAYALNLRT